MDVLSKEELLEKVKNANAVYLDQISEDLLMDAGLEAYVAVLPIDFKSRIKYMGNLLAQMCFNHKMKDEALKLEFHCIATALSYLLNSSSFDTDQYKDFDKKEIARKLRRTNSVGETYG